MVNEAEHIRVLLLEDNPQDAELVERELRRASMPASFRRVETEAAFRAALEHSDPDIILADYHLPQFDGISALRIATRLVPDIPFIFVSGGIGEERAVQTLREGATDYIIKDRLSRLPAAVMRALAERRERTLRKRAQHALALSEERFHRASQATQEVIWDWDVATDRLWFSEALRTVWQYHDLPSDEVDVRWWIDRIHPEDRQRIEEALGAALKESDQWSGEYRFQRGDGSYGHVYDRATIMRDESGRAHRLICAMLDVTEKKRAAEMLEESERRFRSVAETARDGIVLLNASGEILFWNAGAAAIFGYAAAEVVGASVSAILVEHDRLALEERRRMFLETRDAAVFADMIQLTGVRRDGSHVPVECSDSPWEHDGQVFFTKIIRDITRRVQVEAAQRLSLTVSRVLSTATGVDDAVVSLFRELAGTMQWPVGCFWLADPALDQLRCEKCFGAGDDPRPVVSCGRTLRRGEGVGGMVWMTGEPVAAPAGESSGAASTRGRLARVVAIPVIEQDDVIGVFEFFHDQPAYTDAAVLQTGRELGRRIGDFFQRREIEERLFEQEALLSDAEEVAQLGSWSLDLQTGAVRWSHGAARLLGFDRTETNVEHCMNKLVHPEDRDLVRRNLTPPYAGPLVEFHHRAIVRGEVRHINCRFRVTSGTTTEPAKLVGTAQDVTEQHEHLETIRRLSHRNETILTHAAEAIIGVDSGGRITFANRATASMTGWSLDELLAARLHDVLHPPATIGRDCTPATCRLFDIPRDRSTHAGDETCGRRSGATFPARYSCSAIVDEGEITGAVYVLDDVSERKRMELQIERANRVSSLGRVAATIAHEVNNVLMGIQPFAEVIRATGDEKVRRAAAQIIDSVGRGKRVTQEILRFTQESEPALKPIAVTEWLEQLATELRATLGERVRLELQLPPHPLWILGDRAQLHQVISNLVLNAADAMPDGGLVTITASGADDTTALVRVSDTGVGMPPHVLQNIFEPLFTTKRTGTGLGLAVVQQIVARHHGTIQVESEPGHGTTFSITLPRSERGRVEEAASTQLASRVRRVLLVEDEPLVAAGLREVLGFMGVDVFVCARGDEAIAAIESVTPDAVILDMRLPDMTGSEVYERLTAIRPGIPTLFSTGNGDESALKRYLAAEEVAFLHKPYDIDTLLRVLESIVPADPVSGAERR